MRQCLWNVTTIVAATAGCENQAFFGENWDGAKFRSNGAPGSTLTLLNLKFETGRLNA
jgi:hypothetical protein